MVWRKWLFVPPLAIAALLFAVMLWSGSGDAVDPPAPAPTAVRVAPLTTAPFIASAAGFGRVEPEETWQAIAQVAGRVVELPSNVAVGRVVKKHALLARIDPRDYEIARDKAKANLASATASLEELAVQETNTASLLQIEKRILTVREAEYERQKALRNRGASAQAALDEAERSLLAQQKVVRDLENQMRLYPVQRQTHQATIRTRQVELEEAERDLANTRIIAPFTGRVSEKTLAAAQFVREGDSLLKLENIATAEVVAEIQPSELRRVIAVHGPERLRAVLDSRDGGEALEFLKQLDLTAEVVVRAEAPRIVWEAEIARITGRLDEATGTLGLAVRVSDPTQANLTKRRPPLTVGAFVEVRISAKPRPLLLIPRGAVRRDPDLREPFIYVMDEGNLLARRTVRLGPVFDDVVALRGGAKAGERLILSDLNPPILGMPLRAVSPTEPEAKPSSAAAE